MTARIFLLLAAAFLVTVAALIVADVRDQTCNGIEVQRGWHTTYADGVRVAVPRWECVRQP